MQDNFPYRRSEIPRQRDWFQRRGIFKEAPLHFTSEYKSYSLSMCWFKRTFCLFLLLVIRSSSSEVIVLFLCSHLDIFSPFDLCMYDDEGMYCHNVRFLVHIFFVFPSLLPFQLLHLSLLSFRPVPTRRMKLRSS